MIDQRLDSTTVHQQPKEEFFCADGNNGVSSFDSETRDSAFSFMDQPPDLDDEVERCLEEIEQRDDIDKPNDNQFTGEISNDFSWSSAFSVSPESRDDRDSSAVGCAFDEPEVFRNSPAAAMEVPWNSQRRMLFHPVDEDSELLDQNNQSMERVPESLLLQQVSTFSNPDCIPNLRDSQIEPSFDFSSNFVGNENSFNAAQDLTARPMLDLVDEESTSFASYPTQPAPAAFRQEVSPIELSPRFGMETGQYATNDQTDGRVVIQTAHGPALLLLGQDMCPPSPTVGIPTVAKPTTPTVAPSNNRKFQRWSEEEDEMLKHAIEHEGQPPHNWKRIARKYFSNSRSGLQCKSRWTKSLQPGLVRGGWQSYEDNLIVELRSDGLKWSSIAESLNGRIGEHVRDRYVNFLDPKLKKSPWSKNEDSIMFQQQRILGNRWTEISKMLPGRSENAVKNRWHNAKMTQRRRMRKQATERSRLEQSKRARRHCESPITSSDDDDSHLEDYSVVGV